MKCSSSECGSYNTTLDKGPLLRLVSKEGEEPVFTPLTEAEIGALSNVSFPVPDNVSDISSEGSASDDGWETTEEVVEENNEVATDPNSREMVEEDLD